MSTLFADLRRSLPKEWKLHRIDEVATVSSGTTPARSQQARYFDGGSIPWVKTGDLNNGHITTTDEQITDIAVKECSVQLYPPNTVLVAMYGGFKQIGRTGQLVQQSATNQAMSALQIKNGDIDSDYLQDWLNAKVRLWKRFAASSRKDPNVTGSDVAAFPIAHPPLPEQQKIAAILSTWDRAIELTEKLIAAKQKRKQALMQQLLTGKVRLTGAEAKPWKEVKLRRLLTGRNEQIPNDGTHPLYSLTIEDGVTPKSERYNREFLVRDKSSKKYKIVYPGDIVFNPSNLRWGAIGIHNGVGPVLVSPIYEVLYVTDEDSTNKEFLFQQLSSSRQIQLFSGMAEGTLVERTAVKLPTFFACKILVPPTVEEQTRVARILSVTDSEIDFMSKRKAILSKQKKGLMQQLLTGKVRVNVDQETGEA